MIRQLRTALLWLLLLALPFQGFAAATRVSCGPDSHQTAGAGAAPQGPEGHGRHQHIPQAAADTAADAELDHHPAAAAHGVGHSKSALQQLDKRSKSHCSACAACCMGVALAPAALVIAACLPALLTSEFCPAPHLDHVSDGLDRPPRPTLV